MKFENDQIKYVAEELHKMGLNPHTWACMIEGTGRSGRTDKICFVYFEFNERVYIVQQATWSRPYALGFTLSVQLVPSRGLGSSMHAGSEERREHGITGEEMIDEIKYLIGKNYKPLRHKYFPKEECKFFTSIEEYNKRNAMDWHILKPIYTEVSDG